jgi:hypothetical protein
MPKRPTNDSKSIQLELMPTETTRQKVKTADVTKAHFIKQSKIIGKLYDEIEREMKRGNLTIDESKKVADSMRVLGIWNDNFWEGMTKIEQQEAEVIIANGGEFDFDKMSVEELLEWA